MDPRGYLIWETSFAATDSILNSVTLPRGEICYLGLRNRSNAMFIKTGPDNKVIYEKEIITPDRLCSAGSLIHVGPGQVIALLSFPGYQTLNWINVTKGEIQKSARIPAGMTVTGIRKDLQGNLMLAAYTGEILLLKNTGITF